MLLEEVEETLVVVTVDTVVVVVVVVVLDDPPPAVVVVVADGSKTEVGGGQAEADSRVSMANRALGSFKMRVIPNSIPI